MGLSGLFRIMARTRPEQPALVYDGRVTTYGEADRRIDRLATGLRRQGLRRGDAVAVMLHNRPEFFELQGAMARLGGSAVSVSWRSTPAELAYVLQHSGARAVFFEHDQIAVVSQAQGLTPDFSPDRLFPVGGEVSGRCSYDQLLVPHPEGDFDGTEGSVVIYTSGTTGKPRGAVRSFGLGQSLGFLAVLDRVPFRTTDRHLAVCPLYHSTGFGFAGMSLTVGATVVIQRDFDPEGFLQAIERHRITTTVVVPTMLHRVLALPESTFQRYHTASLQVLLCGGAQLSPALAKRTLQTFGPVLYNFYGATETGVVSVATPADLTAAPGSIGRPLHGVSVRLLGEDGREVSLGDVGELYARSTMLVDGYHRDPTATRESIRDGYFSVGDLATVDASGRLAIVGRRRDMVISGGVNIYPVEIEAVIEKHPGVAQVAVVGVLDEAWGERLRAFVVLRTKPTDTTVQDLKTHCREHLSGPKVPKDWVFLDALPANPTGKVLKRELQTWVGEVRQG